MNKAIGIDFGYKNCIMAIKQGHDLRTLQNKENDDLTPSIVGSYKGKTIIGGLAIDYMASDAKNTIISIKSLIGRSYLDPQVRRIRDRYNYLIVSPSDGTSDDIRVILGGREYSPVQISSMILKKLKEDAEKRLNATVDQAVITVPAYFTEKQKDAMRKAGHLAGLKVQHILAEPTAVAMTFGMDKVGIDESKTILIYDLTACTFDVSVLTVVGGIIAELNIEGDMWLGGDDFDHKIMDYVLEHIKKEYGIDAKGDNNFILELRKHAEKAKKALSSVSSTDIVLMGKLKDNKGDLIDVELELTRDQFERMISADVQRSIQMVKTAVAKANITLDQIDHVILVGGSSTIPMIRRALIDLFGEKKILMNLDPMKCVAYGAAILAQRLGDSIECPRCKTMNPLSANVCLNDQCGEPLSDRIIYPGIPQDFGIQTEGDRFQVIIPKGFPYPTPEAVVETFYTPVANMRRIKIPVYQGPNEIASKNEKMVTLWLELPEKVPANTPIDFAFRLDSDGILENIKASLKDGSGIEVEVFHDRGDPKRGKVEKELEEIKQKWDAINDEMDKIYGEAIKAANVNNIGEAERLINEMKKLLNLKSSNHNWEGYDKDLLSC